MTHIYLHFTIANFDFPLPLPVTDVIFPFVLEIASLFGFVVDFDDAEIEAAIGATWETDVQRHVICLCIDLKR